MLWAGEEGIILSVMELKGFKLLISQKEIHGIIKRLAVELRREYKDKNPIFIGVLKGSFIFFADLIRELKMPLKIDFIRAASYGDKAVSSGEVSILKDIELPIKDRHILIVEDIVDTGVTLKVIYNHLKEKKPTSIKICALIDKQERKKVKIKLDFVGLVAEKGFIVGYGLDFDERYRCLPDVYIIEEGS